MVLIDNEHTFKQYKHANVFVISLGTFYSEDENRKKFRVKGEDDEITDLTNVHCILLVPLSLLQWLMEKDCTPWEFY